MSLEAHSVTYRVSDRALVEDVCLELRPGEILAVVGPNGAGKSTLLRLLAGDITPTTGRVLLDGRLLATFPRRALALRRAVLPQSTFLAFAFSARDVVLMGRHPHLQGRHETQRDFDVAQDAMSQTETLPVAQRIYPTLSGGEQARVNLARVLAQQAPVLLLDEPTAHLDPHHQHAAMAVAQTLATEGAAVLAVLHDLNLAAVYADRIGLLAGGRLLALGAPCEVLTAERLAAVFSQPFLVTPHPAIDRPLVLPLPMSNSRPVVTPPVPSDPLFAGQP